MKDGLFPSATVKSVLNNHRVFVFIFYIIIDLFVRE